MIPVGTNLERRKFPKATLALIGVNLFVFIVEMLLPPDLLGWTIQHLGFGPATRNPVSLVTSLFLHGDIYHVAFNMLFLWVFGGPVEERIGSKNFLIFYFGAGFVAGVLSVVMEMIARPGSTVPGIGASGAISGIMALFLYRCFYAKLKLVITPLLLPHQVNVPVVPLVLLWFFQDVVMGIFSLSVPTGVGRWAHVGGFAFGIGIGRFKRYGHEGQVEQLRSRIMQDLSKGGGWKSAEKDLLNLLKKTPDDPEVHHDLARLYAERGETAAAERHYAAAAQRYFSARNPAGAYVVIEHADVLSKPMQPQYLLKAAEALVKEHEYEDAHAALVPIVILQNPAGQIVERAMALFVKLSRHLDRPAETEQALQIFGRCYPESRYQGELKAAVAKKPGEVFPPAPAKAEQMSAPSEERSAEVREANWLGFIETFERTFADPVFWLLLLFLNIAGPFFLPGLYFSRLSPLYIFVGAFGMTIVHRMGSISELMSFMDRPLEKQARQEVELRQCYEDAMTAERREQYPAAASLYEKLLTQEPANIHARLSLARIYHKRLNNAVSARRHYLALAKHAPEEHPFHYEAREALKELSAGRTD